MLPADLGTYMPRSAATCGDVGFMRARVSGGYDSVRATALSRDDLRFVSGAMGTAMIQAVPAL